MEDVRAIRVDENAGPVMAVVGIAADVLALVADQHFQAGHGGQAPRHHSPGETCAGDDDIIRPAAAPQARRRKAIGGRPSRRPVARLTDEAVHTAVGAIP